MIGDTNVFVCDGNILTYMIVIIGKYINQVK